MSLDRVFRVVSRAKVCECMELVKWVVIYPGFERNKFKKKKSGNIWFSGKQKEKKIKIKIKKKKKKRLLLLLKAYLMTSTHDENHFGLIHKAINTNCMGL